jgi:hypothetical protein
MSEGASFNKSKQTVEITADKDALYTIRKLCERERQVNIVIMAMQIE